MNKNRNKGGLINYNYQSNYNFSLITVTFTIIGTINILTVGNLLNLAITIPQYLLVMYTLFKGDIRNAALYHFSFFLLSFSLQSLLGMFETTDFAMYNYGTLKLIGPIRASYVVNILLSLSCLSAKLVPSKIILYYRLFVVMVIMCSTATLIGILGLMLHPYYVWDRFIYYTVYMFALISTMYILLCLYNEELAKAAFYITIVTTISSIIASILCFLLGVASHYSVYDIIYTPNIVIMVAPTLLVGFFFVKHRLWIAIAILLFVPICMGVGGKTVFGLVFSLICLVYLLFINDNYLRGKGWNMKKLKPISLVVILAVILVALPKISEESMIFYKFKSAESMFTSDISEISRSPYIRVASLINIFHEGISNPFTLLVGNGYGGYFEDKLGLFEGFNVDQGGWSAEVVASGRFTSGHDTMVTVPLFNGLIGVLLLLRVSFRYIKRVPYNFLNMVVFLWILLMFYFDPLNAVIGAFALFGAEYSLVNFPNKYNSI